MSTNLPAPGGPPASTPKLSQTIYLQMIGLGNAFAAAGMAYQAAVNIFLPILAQWEPYAINPAGAPPALAAEYTTAQQVFQQAYNTYLAAVLSYNTQNLALVSKLQAALAAGN